MASIINALSSGTGGIVTSGDASGILQLQTANTAAVTIDGSQNVGIGTSSPTTKLTVNNASATDYVALTTGGTVKGVLADEAGDLIIKSAASLLFQTNGTIRARLNTTGAFVLAGGTTTANGIGITFPATQSASSDANTLDDYEEGSFTPIFAASGGTTPTTQTGTGAYIKIGRVVHLHGQISWSGSGSAGSNLRIDLPFIVVSGARGALALGIISGFNWSAGHQLTLLPELNTTVAYFVSKDPAGGGHVHRTLSDVSTTGSYLFSFAGSYVTSN
jgi:hypothetical protein